jgi:LytS/YehU family sensor histidine kinase
VFIAGNYYFNWLFTVPRLLNRKKYLVFGLCFIAGIVVGAALRVPVSWLVSKYIFLVNIVSFNPGKVFLDSFVNILFWVVLILASKLIAERIRSQRYIELIEKERAANELNFLRAQFNPHFLFNSINSIYAHIDKSNKNARNMLLLFSEMLRYQLYECNVERIELEREINYIRNYIEIQKSRIDERIHVSFCAGDVGSSTKVPPLMLMAFIENAFKYVGFDESRPNVVDIKLSYQNARLELFVFNTKDPGYRRPAGDSSGLGIANTRRRLELLFPNSYSLDIDNNEHDFKVHLTLMGL